MVDKITTPPSQKDVIDKVNELVDDKQDTLVSGTNIKTINNASILGSGNIDIQGGGTYTAGDGIDITNGVISVDNTIALKSEIPTVNNATLTIQKNSTNVATFTANASSNVTANITVPTTASDIGAQATLVSGTNIKTINNESLLGSGDISVSASPTFTYDSTNERLTIS